MATQTAKRFKGLQAAGVVAILAGFVFAGLATYDVLRDLPESADRVYVRNVIEARTQPGPGESLSD